jgi:hypothetical protein
MGPDLIAARPIELSAIFAKRVMTSPRCDDDAVIGARQRMPP